MDKNRFMLSSPLTIMATLMVISASISIFFVVIASALS